MKYITFKKFSNGSLRNTPLPKKVFFLMLIIPLSLSQGLCAKDDSLRLALLKIIEAFPGDVGVGIKHLENGDTLMINGNTTFPMQSVFKFPLAMAVLHYVDNGTLSMKQNIHIDEKDLMPNTVSAIADKYPNGNIDMTLAQVLTYTVSQSDNNGCDILFKLLGGTKIVDDYVQGLGIKEIAITATEQEMSKNWSVQFTNWCTPMAMIQLLETLYKQRVLSNHSNTFLWKTMVETTRGNRRLRYLLPANTEVAHRPGTSGTNDKGEMAAINDVGIVKLAQGSYFAIAVFISNTKEGLAKSEELIAKIAKVVFDYYAKK